jgi:hypothetical protein
MTIEIGGYDMDGVMLDMASDVNIFSKKYWEVMGNPKLFGFPSNFISPINTISMS